MPNLIVTDREENQFTLSSAAGPSIMEVIRDSGVGDLLAMCGGCCSCATCHVYVDAAFIDRLPPANEDERDLLDFSEHQQAGSRLACQIPLTVDLDGIRLTIAPED